MIKEKFKTTLKRYLSILRHRTFQIGSHSYVHVSSSFNCQSKIGKYSFVNKNSFISATTIGNYCSISANVGIGLGEHDLIYGTSKALSTRPLLTKKTTLGDEVWIGFGAVVIQGITIGDGAVIAANAVVTKDVPDYAIMAGVPAKMLRFRFSRDEIERRKQNIDYSAEPDEIKSKILDNNSP